MLATTLIILHSKNKKLIKKLVVQNGQISCKIKKLLVRWPDPSFLYKKKTYMYGRRASAKVGRDSMFDNPKKLSVLTQVLYMVCLVSSRSDSAASERCFEGFGHCHRPLKLNHFKRNSQYLNLGLFEAILIRILVEYTVKLILRYS